MNSFEGCVSYFTLVREFAKRAATPQGDVRFGPRADIGAGFNGSSSWSTGLHRRVIHCEPLQENSNLILTAIRGYKAPIPSDSGFLPFYNRAIVINHFRLPANKNGETAHDNHDEGNGRLRRSDRIWACSCPIYSGLTGSDGPEFFPD